MTVKETAHGAKSTIFEDENMPDLIIKENRNPNNINNQGWLSKQMKGYNIIKRIRESGLDYGVELPELIEIVDTPEKKQIIEKKLYGKDFTTEIYNELDKEKKEELAIQMAKFFNAMHQMEKPKPAKNSLKEQLVAFTPWMQSAQDIINVFENNLSPKLETTLRDAEKILDNTDKSDEICVNTHTDIRFQNVMYNPENNKLSVIDFEMTQFDNIYQDFVPSCHGLSWDFIQRVIKHYNNIPNKKYPITINPNKVKNGLIFSIAHEYARVLYLNKRENLNPDVKEQANVLLHRLTEDSLLDFSETELFNQGIKKLETYKQNVPQTLGTERS